MTDVIGGSARGFFDEDPEEESTMTTMRCKAPRRWTGYCYNYKLA